MEAEYNEAHPLLGDAVQALRSQPVLLRFCADEAAKARHTAVFQAFLVALTRGGPGGVPKPLEAHSNDPECGPMYVFMCISVSELFPC
jgi:conserved oligomeric Golgi complex subunit 6